MSAARSGLGPLFAGAPFSNDSTSLEAARAIAPAKATLRERVFAAIVAQGSRGATACEIQAATGMSGDTVRPRLVELRGAGRAYEAGERRTPSGRVAKVWRAR